jgi:hypothetical protein
MHLKCDGYPNDALSALFVNAQEAAPTSRVAAW